MTIFNSLCDIITLGMLNKEYKYYTDNKKKLLRRYKGKVLVLVGEKISGVYNNEAEAYTSAIKEYKLGTFLVQKCIPDEEAIQTFHSRVRFSE